MLKIKHYLSLLLATTLLLGGCQSTNHETESKQSETQKGELPNTRAFQDDFTRQFIKSSKETETNYYTLQSKTNQYEMLFPKNGVIDEMGYSHQKNDYEYLLIGFKLSQDRENSLKVTYRKNRITEDEGVTYILESLKNDVHITEDFQKYHLGDQVLYVAPYKMKTGSFGYVGYIHPINGIGGVEMNLYQQCYASKQPCDSNDDLVKQTSLHIMKSVHFTNEEKQN